MALQQIRRVVVHDAIIENVLTYIHENRLAEGERIPAERTLATTLGVSRGSVREALKALEAAGVLTIRHGGGAYFASQAALNACGAPGYTRDQAGAIKQALDILAARSMIETCVAARLAPVITDEQLAQLEGIERQQHEAQTSAASATPLEIPNLAIELAMTAMLGNPVILELHSRLEPQWKAAFAALAATPFAPAERHNRHVAVVDALRTREPKAAVAAMAEQIRILQTFLEKQLKRLEARRGK